VLNIRIYRVTITIDPSDQVDFFVRATSTTQARSLALEPRVESRLATQSDIIEMIHEDHEIIGLAQPESDTKDLPFTE
jgi:hypothetical protein